MVTSGGGRVVGDTGTVVVVGGGDEAVVTFGATVVFPAAVITQSAARQPTAKSSGRDSPDIASSALALEQKLGHPRLRPSLCPEYLFFSSLCKDSFSSVQSLSLV